MVLFRVLVRVDLNLLVLWEGAIVFRLALKALEKLLEWVLRMTLEALEKLRCPPLEPPPPPRLPISSLVTCVYL